MLFRLYQTKEIGGFILNKERIIGWIWNGKYFNFFLKINPIMPFQWYNILWYHTKIKVVSVIDNISIL